jgi:hypothetical protein
MGSFFNFPTNNSFGGVGWGVWKKWMGICFFWFFFFFFGDMVM